MKDVRTSSQLGNVHKENKTKKRCSLYTDIPHKCVCSNCFKTLSFFPLLELHNIIRKQCSLFYTQPTRLLLVPTPAEVVLRSHSVGLSFPAVTVTVPHSVVFQAVIVGPRAAPVRSLVLFPSDITPTHITRYLTPVSMTYDRSAVVHVWGHGLMCVFLCV